MLLIGPSRHLVRCSDMSEVGGKTEVRSHTLEMT